MYLLIIFMSFFGSFLAGFFGRFFGANGATRLTISCLSFSFILSIFIFYEVSILGCNTYICLTPWIESELLKINWGFMFDSLTSVMCVVVTFISLLVHVYSVEYMSHDPHLPRFMSYLSLFTFFMLILVTADNFVQMFIGWEGVGLCSYLLINFWFTRIQANKAAIKAMILNRIGDFSLLIGIMLLFTYFKTLNYTALAAVVPLVKKKYIVFFAMYFNLLSLIGVFLFIGAVGKSAQIGLHTWLPDAMEGPTPVSALIHAATMVTAGVFLIARSSFIFEEIKGVLNFIVVIGATTAILASTIGLVQNDLKRVIAYSTCSQLGYMVFACGLSNYSVGVFHLSNHAFFKALLFLSAGAIIHGVNDEQDMRKMGGLKNLLPLTYAMVLIGSLALTGFPFLAGFYSKDFILEVAYSKYTKAGQLAYILGTISAFFTAFYSMRLLCLTFLTEPNGYRSVLMHAHEPGLNIILALICLSIPSLFIGYLTKDMFIGAGSTFFSNVLCIKQKSFNLFDAEFISYTMPIFLSAKLKLLGFTKSFSWLLKSLPVILSLLGTFLAIGLYLYKFKILLKLKFSFIGKKLYQFLNRKWFFDKLYNEIFSQFLFKFSYFTSYKFIDRGVLEMLGPTGISFTFLNVAESFHKIQSGYLYHYTSIILFGSTILIALHKIVTSGSGATFNFLFVTLFIGLTLFLSNTDEENV
jgi:NADH-ubiquinone oxidoreductase chain 5